MKGEELLALQFQETIVTGSPRDFMEARHLVLRGSNYEIGRKLGEIARERHHVRKAPGADPLRTRCQRRYLEKNYPIHLERMRGMADAYGVNLEDDAIDFSLLGDPVGNLGCSAVYYPPQTTSFQHGVISRNEDFITGTLGALFGAAPKAHERPAASRPYVMEVYPDKGYPSLFVLSFELFGECLDGINSEGLAVAHLADEESMLKYPMEPTMSHAVGLHELQGMRLLLDTCADVNEAKEALLTNKHFYMMVPVHYLIADRHGNSFVWRIALTSKIWCSQRFFGSNAEKKSVKPGTG